jgi:GTPase SAR1 family protein
LIFLLQIQHYCPTIPIILVGNKTDLSNDSIHRQVSTSQALMVADEIKAVTYLECSAKAKEGLQQVILCAVRAALQAKMKGRKYCVLF